MTDSEEYVDLKKATNLTYKDEYLDEDLYLDDKCVSGYQVQSMDNTNWSYIIEVGKFTKIPSVIINKFDLSPKVKCIITSCFYDKKTLIESNGTLSMIKLLINSNTDQLRPVGCLLLNFNTTGNLLDCLYKGAKLDGYWTITFHIKDRLIILEEYRKYLGNSKMIEELITHVLDDRIQHIINKLI